MAAQPNIGGALCKSSVIPFFVARHKFWLTPAAQVLCSNAANKSQGDHSFSTMIFHDFSMTKRMNFLDLSAQHIFSK